MGALISLDAVTFHPDSWCVCRCYLHFAPENPEGDEMYLLIPAHPGCPEQSPESFKMVVCVQHLFMLGEFDSCDCCFVLFLSCAY